MNFQLINQKLKSIGKSYWLARDLYSRSAISFMRLFDKKHKKRPRILFYNIMGLGYTGTDKFLQVLAKNMNKEVYDVYFMYGEQDIPSSGVHDISSRLSYILEGKVFPIRFDYKLRQSSQPYFVEGMSPSIFDVIKDFQIDLFVTAGAGNPEYPVSAIRSVPVIFINIFGEPNIQKNITNHVCISNEVADHLRTVVAKEKIKVMYVPSEGPVINSKQYGLELRRELGLSEQAFVFGRIGRSSEGIFDPIGIRAFQQVVKKFPHSHYLIVSPPKTLEDIVKTEKIPNVHFVKASGKEAKLWGFYEAMDVLAHFRKDGESFGLNIVEAMFCGKPVISHRSRQWNAHLEYLDKSFSFVADTDNVGQYAAAMEFFANPENYEKVKLMGKIARKKAFQISHISNHIGNFEKMVAGSLK